MRWRRKKAFWRLASRLRTLKNQKMSTLSLFRESSLDEVRFRGCLADGRKWVSETTVRVLGVTTSLFSGYSQFLPWEDFQWMRSLQSREMLHTYPATAFAKRASSWRRKLRSPKQTSRSHPSKMNFEGESQEFASMWVLTKSSIGRSFFFEILTCLRDEADFDYLILDTK
jgi:hypothetical protein